MEALTLWRIPTAENNTGAGSQLLDYSLIYMNDLKVICWYVFLILSIFRRPSSLKSISYFYTVLIWVCYSWSQWQFQIWHWFRPKRIFRNPFKQVNIKHTKHTKPYSSSIDKEWLSLHISNSLSLTFLYP